jgi:hypothetical protein
LVKVVEPEQVLVVVLVQESGVVSCVATKKVLVVVVLDFDVVSCVAVLDFVNVVDVVALAPLLA